MDDDEAGSEQVTRRSWFWAFDALSRPKAGGVRLRINIPDTVLFNENEPVGWLFTSKEGEVLRRHAKRLRLDTICDTLLSYAARDAMYAKSRPSQTYALATRSGSESSADVKAHLLTEAEVLTKLQNGGLAGGLLALQTAVPSRGGGGARYRCEAATAKDGIGLRFNVTKLAYLGRPMDCDMPHPRSTEGAALEVPSAFDVKCTMQGLIAELNGLTAMIVKHLSEISRSRVVRLQADYILTTARSDEAPILVALPLVCTAALPPPPPKPTTSAAPATTPSDLPSVPTDPKLIQTLISTAPPPEVAHTQQQQQLGKSSSTISVLSSLENTRGDPVLSPSRRFANMEVANERIGLSQITSHRKDMSNEMIRAIEKGIITDPTKALPLQTRHESEGKALPNFGPRPKPWMRLHQPQPYGFEQGGDRQGRKVALCVGDFCQFVESRTEASPEGHSRYSSPNRSPQKTPNKSPQLSPQRSLSGTPHQLSPQKSLSGTPHHAAPENALRPGERGKAECTIPYRSLLQARAERAVANSQPVSQEYDGATLREACLAFARPGRSHPLGPQRPSASTFYSEVKVCANCFRIYSRLDAQRAHTESPYGSTQERRLSRPSTAATFSRSIMADLSTSAAPPAAAPPAAAPPAAAAPAAAPLAGAPSAAALAGPAHAYRTGSIRRAITEQGVLQIGTDAGADEDNEPGSEFTASSQRAIRRLPRSHSAGAVRSAPHQRQALNHSVSSVSFMNENDYEAKLGAAETYNEVLGRKNVKRLLAELQRHNGSHARPSSALPKGSLRKSTSSATSIALGGAWDPRSPYGRKVVAAYDLLSDQNDSSASLYAMADLAPGELGVAFGIEPEKSLKESRVKPRRQRPQSAHAALLDHPVKNQGGGAGTNEHPLVHKRPESAKGLLTMTAKRRSRPPDADAQVENNAWRVAVSIGAKDDSHFVSLVVQPATTTSEPQPLANDTPVERLARVDTVAVSQAWFDEAAKSIVPNSTSTSSPALIPISQSETVKSRKSRTGGRKLTSDASVQRAYATKSVSKRPSSAALDKEDKDDEDEEAMLLRRLEEVRARKSERAVERAAKTG